MSNFFDFLFWFLSVIVSAICVSGLVGDHLRVETVELELLQQLSVSIFVGSSFFLGFHKLCHRLRSSAGALSLLTRSSRDRMVEF